MIKYWKNQYAKFIVESHYLQQVYPNYLCSHFQITHISSNMVSGTNGRNHNVRLIVLTLLLRRTRIWNLKLKSK